MRRPIDQADTTPRLIHDPTQPIMSQVDTRGGSGWSVGLILLMLALMILVAGLLVHRVDLVFKPPTGTQTLQTPS
jgi:hypothetical protein